MNESINVGMLKGHVSIVNYIN